MIEDSKNIKQFSSADIQKYLQGKLSAAEMHTMEKAAMDDPFLADAIEGMQNNLSFTNDIEELKKRLAERVEEKNKIISISPNRLWWRVAAAVVVLLGTTGLMYNYFGRSSFSKENIAATRQEAIVADSIVQQNKLLPSASQADTAGKSDITENEKPVKKIIAGNEEKQVASAKKESKKNKANKDASDDITFNKKEIKQKEYEPVLQTDSVKTNIDSSLKNITVNNPPPPSNSIAIEGKAAGISIQRDKAKYQNSFSGKVIDANRQPIIGASVLLKNKRTGVTTDNNGAFKLNTNDKDSLINVVVNSVGFNAASTTLSSNNASANVIELQPASNALNEVVVVGYGIQKKDSTEDDDTTDAPLKFSQKVKSQKAIPATGWRQYDNYLDSNKKITTADSTIKGKEVVSFTVNKKGDRSDFKIEQSLSPAHDAEAIRLVKEGPAWKLLKGKKARATLIIQF
jgi:carboxypeptidase-like protein